MYWWAKFYTMAFIRIFKTPNHNKFDYNPQYWDPQKEDLEERIESVDKRYSDDSDAMKSRISRGLRHRTRSGDSDTRGFRSQQVKKSNTTLVIVLIVLVILAVILLSIFAPELQAVAAPGQTI